ncbi:hypothetical protein ACTMTJ_14300 [Phytohabitans sp. LJ34]|uniref:hypothetical protein n=1 Tax=Phytohabitans sp. LJ34 TaxID=3452217 RepID=UPI003F8A9BC1
MVDEPVKASRWAFRLVAWGGAVVGLVLVVAAVAVDDPPLWWWLVGVPLALVCGLWTAMWARFRLRHRTPEARRRALAELAAKQEAVAEPVERSRLAYRATKHKKAVLRSGGEATAVVRFLADGGRANQFRQLVYMELEVSRPGQESYVVKTGEFLTAASAGSVAPGRVLQVKVDERDPQRVAVDWERSLRLVD